MQHIEGETKDFLRFFSKQIMLQTGAKESKICVWSKISNKLSIYQQTNIRKTNIK